MNLGAHMSISGGLDRAVARAEEVGATALQIFTRNQVRWRARDLTERETEAFRRARAASPIEGAIAHANYLVNLASPDDDLYRRSITGLALDYDRSEALGLDGLVFHPGAHMGSGVEAGLSRVAAGVRGILAERADHRCRILFETTAGAGSQLGGRFEELARLIATSGDPRRLGICLDTCHIFAAGYDIRTAAAYRRMRRELDSIVGLAHVHAVHLNDSRGELGSHVDRHEHIGRGQIGPDGFRALMRDAKLARIPKILETPKGTYRRQSWDRRNLTILRQLRDES